MFGLSLELISGLPKIKLKVFLTFIKIIFTKSRKVAKNF